MFSGKKTDFISWVLLIGVLLLVLELSFRGGELIFFFLVMAGCIYIGRKKLPRTFGKVLFWGGWFGLAISVLNMMAFKFVMIAVLVYLVVQFYQSRKNPAVIEPTVTKEDSQLSEPLFTKQPLFHNKLYGRQKTPDHVYEWNDINIQCGIGDAVIDLSNTVLPDGESIITIRSLAGNIKILIPYEAAVSVQHSVLAGSTTIFQHNETKILNQQFHFHTENYHEAQQKIKIITSFIIGDLEVKRT